MGKVLFGIIAAVASFMLVDSLTCNQCPFGLVGFCFIPKQQICTFNTSVCYTGLATFPALSSFAGFNTQGCLDNTTTCNTTSTASILNVTYNTQTSCCSSDKCNPVQISSGATTSARMTITATIGAAVLASVWGSLL
ncbi:hypothetical protein EXN66_Car000452 [Channa argus]|uniref:UPAR/Ly6 domain-containing protein n=1 Tax=Channa argus TaxID=215402 RepID=A0A6G1QY89_CHAAH|nr:hypothetical protein EXN66_Car000452 [Channa argus]KAK2920927.1 hypothetical protein Q8A73_000412 [Channa argus]